MKVLALFDGISCGQVAMHRAGLVPSRYYASEIDKSAIGITQRNHPKTIQLGDITNVRQLVDANAFADIDLIIGGSPCQGFSRIGRNRGFNDPRSRLIFDFIHICKKFPNAKYILENVRLNDKDRMVVSTLLGIEAIEIDSTYFSGQRRKRLYWTNIPIAPFHDRKISALSVLENNIIIPNSLTWHHWFYRNRDRLIKTRLCSVINDHEKAITLLARHVANWQGNIVRLNDVQYRHLTPIEAERLQTLPDNYTKGAALTKRFHHIGNGWTVDVIAHILRGMR